MGRNRSSDFYGMPPARKYYPKVFREAQTYLWPTYDYGGEEGSKFTCITFNNTHFTQHQRLEASRFYRWVMGISQSISFPWGDAETLSDEDYRQGVRFMCLELAALFAEDEYNDRVRS